MGKIAMTAILAFNGTAVSVNFEKQAEVYNPFLTTTLSLLISTNR